VTIHRIERKEEIMTTLQIPALIHFVLRRDPDKNSLGLLVRQGADDAVEVARIKPESAASRTPLEVGFEILSIHDHRVKNAQRCVEMLKHYTHKEESVEIVASAGVRPNGARYVLIKRDGSDAEPHHTSDDGSLHGLFLENKRGRVLVSGMASSGLFVNSKINKGDMILSIAGRPIHEISDCDRALKKVTRGLIPILTYNPFRKLRSTIQVNTMREKHQKPVEKETEKHLPRRTVGELYAFGPTIGSGAYADVKKCKSKETGEIFAMKIVNRKSLDKGMEDALRGEIMILNEINHKHVMRLYDTFTTINAYYLVTEYLEGGELFDRIVQKTNYTEMEARNVCKILFGAMEYLHDKRIVHRDLKPENLLLQYPDSDSELKIADFGFSTKAPTEHSLRTICGSPGYVSPEILRKDPYGTQTDMWSLGVIVFILIGGYPPFDHPDQKVKFNLIKKGLYKFVDKYWGTVSDEAKSLVRSLLCIDPEKRLSAAKALEHPWMQVHDENLRRSSLISNMKSLRDFNAACKFKSAVKSVSC